MVLYFSATGNTKYIAKMLAQKLGDVSLDLLERIRTNDRTVIRSPKPYVICCPVYICEMPRFLTDFIRKQKFAGNRKVYFVFTCGGASGISGAAAAEIIKGKKMVYMGSSDIKMPNNYIASDLFKAQSEDEMIYRIKSAEYIVDNIVLNIKMGRQLKIGNSMPISKAFMAPATTLWAKIMQPSSPFRTTDKCEGCGKCERLCPLNNIHLVDKKPVWKRSCAHCMACICGCPKEAIEYGDITQDKFKYHINKIIDECKDKE